MRKFVLSSVAIIFFLVNLDVSFINLAALKMGLFFHVDDLQLQWLNLANLLSFATCLTLSGKLTDRLGEKKLMLYGLTLFTICNMLTGISPNYGFVIFGRFLQGISGAFLIIPATAFLFNAFPLERKATAMAFVGGATAIALGVGPLIGGGILSLLNWRYLFFFNIPFVAFIFTIVVKYCPSNNNKNASEIPLLRSSLLAGGICCLIYSISAISTPTYQIPTSLIVIASLFFFSAFAFFEIKATTPYLDFHLLKQTVPLCASIIRFFINGFSFFFFFSFATILHGVFLKNSFQSGIVMLFPAACFGLAMLLSTQIIHRYGCSNLIAFSTTLTLLCYVAQATQPIDSSLLLITGVNCILLFSIGMLFNATTTTFVSHAAADKVGSAIGLLYTLTFTGAGIVFSLLSTFYTSAVKFDASHHVSSVFTYFGSLLHAPTASVGLTHHSAKVSGVLAHSSPHTLLSAYASAMLLLAIFSLVIFVSGIVIKFKPKYCS